MLYGALLDALCLGQALETATVDSCVRTEAEYLAAVEGKTAALIAGACRLGGMQVTDGESELGALDSFGRSFGLAFQLLDDIADIVLSDEELGKPSMQDLREGVITHPVICALRDNPAFDSVVVGVRTGAVSAARARDAIRAVGCIDETRRVASRFVEDARRALLNAQLPGDPAPLLACIDDHLAPLLAREAGQP
jgi:geranylgeranyl pyrophosphate synthase